MKQPTTRNQKPAITIVQASSQGFSLIELLVSIALLGIIAGIGVSLFAIINNAYNRADAVSRMQTQGQQSLEQVERSIRSASGVQLLSSTDPGCSATQCLVLTVPAASIEYTLNGGCSLTGYSWTDANFTQGSIANGSLKRYSPTGGSGTCSAAPIELFDADPSTGISVEPNGGDVFTVNTSSAISNVAISLTLTQGAQMKPSGNDTRVKVSLKTTTSMRKY